jgi:hypothetical protein
MSLRTRPELAEYYRWRNQHRGRRRGNPTRVKLRHRCWFAAVLHAHRVTRVFGGQYSVYLCRWHDDFRKGERAWPHWHVGTRNRYGINLEENR